MRKHRELAAHVWYYVSTAVNDREPLFWGTDEVWLFERSVGEANEVYPFEIRRMRFDGAAVSFYIRPADGFRLPDIMKLIKQTFAARYNLLDGRTGHIWGDRYSSEIIAGEPPEWAERYGLMAIARPVRRGDWRREAVKRGFRPQGWKHRCHQTCPVRTGQTLAPTGGGKSHIPVGFPRQSDPLSV
jgi:hypothetical protein